MKYLLLVFLSVLFACVYGTHLTKSVQSESTLNEEIGSKIDWKELRALVETEVRHNLRAGSVTADVTNYTIALLENVGKFISSSDLDPMGLDSTVINLLPTGTITLTNGTLQDLSTITAYDDVLVKYTHDTGILELTLPLGFDALLIDYNYVVKVLLVKVSGTIAAKVDDLKLNLHMGFNFSDYQAFVDKIDVKNSGSITIDFHGLGPLDYLVELLTNTLTTLFHGIILSVVNAIIYDPVNDVVDQINDLIDGFLHPNSTILSRNIY